MCPRRVLWHCLCLQILLDSKTSTLKESEQIKFTSDQILIAQKPTCTCFTFQHQCLMLPEKMRFFFFLFSIFDIGAAPPPTKACCCQRLDHMPQSHLETFALAVAVSDKGLSHMTLSQSFSGWFHPSTAASSFRYLVWLESNLTLSDWQDSAHEWPCSFYFILFYFIFSCKQPTPFWNKPCTASHYVAS